MRQCFGNLTNPPEDPGAVLDWQSTREAARDCLYQMHGGIVVGVVKGITLAILEVAAGISNLGQGGVAHHPYKSTGSVPPTSTPRTG
jgi:hypothetical protein